VYRRAGSSYKEVQDVTTLTDYMIKVSEDKEENRKYMEDHEAALAGSGLSEDHKNLLREEKLNRDKIGAAILEEAPDARMMASFMVSQLAKKHPAGGHRP
jgi:hypothetical protein